MLNKLILTAIAAIMFIGMSAQSGSDILMTVGDNKVTVDEFRYIYEKNNGQQADYSKESLDEYIDLYTKFKLKVSKAKDMKLDTITALNKELDGYRTQLANSYLTDRGVLDKLIEEMHERKKQDVRSSHILIKVNARAANKEKEEAKKKLLNIKQQLREGKSFAELAQNYSEDINTKKKGGDLGFITANLPIGFYELENVLYDLGPNEVSEPIKTKLGYHLVKVTMKRPARGKVEVAHIFLKVSKSDRENLAINKKLMDSIYVALQDGADFGKLAAKYSEDKTTNFQNGVLPAFGIAFYDAKFEDTAFGLAKIGEISRPILTSVGYHIIKKIKIIEPETKAKLKVQYKERIKKFDRYNVALKEMISEIKETSKFRERKSILVDFANTLTPEFYTYKWNPTKDIGNELLLSFGSEDNETIYDFARYAKKQTRLRNRYEKEKPLLEAVEEIYEEFVKEKAYSYEQANLELKYPEFKSLMREYQEGILLFEATKINVWDKANTDTIGLYTFYEQNKSKYIFEEQATIGKFIVNTTDEKKLKKVMKCAKKKSSEKILAQYNKGGAEMVEYSELKVEPGSKELIGLQFKEKSISPPVIDNINGKSLFKKIIKVEPSRRKSLKEARGYVVADYQDQLEKQWIKDLKKTYPVELNQKVYKALLK